MLRLYTTGIDACFTAVYCDYGAFSMIRFWRRRRRWVSKNLEILVKKKKWVGTNLEDLVKRKKMGTKEFGNFSEEEEMGRYEFGSFGEDKEDGYQRIWKVFVKKKKWVGTNLEDLVKRKKMGR
jgi:hypothetical protein